MVDLGAGGSYFWVKGGQGVIDLLGFGLVILETVLLESALGNRESFLMFTVRGTLHLLQVQQDLLLFVLQSLRDVRDVLLQIRYFGLLGHSYSKEYLDRVYEMITNLLFL